MITASITLLPFQYLIMPEALFQILSIEDFEQKFQLTTNEDLR